MPVLPQALQIKDLRRIIGHNIRTARVKQKMTLNKLSRRTGLNTDKLDRFEMGRCEIGLPHMVSIAVALDMEVAELMVSGEN